MMWPEPLAEFDGDPFVSSNSPNHYDAHDRAKVECEFVTASGHRALGVWVAHGQRWAWTDCIRWGGTMSGLLAGKK